MAAETVEIASVGEYWGHHTVPHELTMRDLRQMRRNFSGPVVIDYDHATQDPDVQRAVAAGWVTEVHIEGDTLMGTVEWTDEAERSIDSDQFRFLSPVIDKHAEDRETGTEIGTELVTLALTNVPFYDHLNGDQGVRDVQNGVATTPPLTERIAMSRRIVNATDLGDWMERRRKELDMSRDELGDEVGLTGGTIGQIERGEIEVPPPDRREQLADALEVTVETIEDRIPDSKLENTHDAMDWQERWKNLKNRLSGILNADAGGELDVLDEARQLRQRVDELEEKLEDHEEIKNERDQLQERVEELEGEVEEQEEIANEELLDEAVENFRIQNSQRGEWEERLEENPEAARMALNSIPKGAAKPGSEVDEPEKTSDSPDVGADNAFHQYARGE